MNDIIEAISCEREIIQLKLLNVPKHPKMIAKIFSILKDEEINVDMISQVTVDDFVQIIVRNGRFGARRVDKNFQKAFGPNGIRSFRTGNKAFLGIEVGVVQPGKSQVQHIYAFVQVLGGYFSAACGDVGHIGPLGKCVKNACR